jgi:type I restriction enzyme S subunit
MSDIFDNNDLPDDWGVAPLEEVVQKTKQTDLQRTPELRFKYVDVSSVSSDTLRIEGFTVYIGKDAPSRARKVIRTNDVYLCYSATLS